MKLSQVLSLVNQVEKSKFISNLDRLCNGALDTDKLLAKAIGKIDGQIKNASGSEINLLFEAVKIPFRREVKEQFMMSPAQINLIVKILTRDGNCVARLSWVEQLYALEWSAVDELSKELRKAMAEPTTDSLSERANRLNIYMQCMKEAYENDRRNNRQARVTDDERSILNVLANKLRISADECTAVEHLIEPIPKTDVLGALNNLREMGVIFISKKRQEVFVPDEMVEILNGIQGKQLPEKHVMRILRTFSDSELSNILKNHNRRIRGVSRIEKITQILHLGIPANNLLSIDMFGNNENTNQRKDRLKQLITDLDIETEKLGVTLEERISLIVDTLKSATEKELDTLSASGFKELLNMLNNFFDDFIGEIKQAFELEENEVVDIDKLRAISITPHDVLYLIPNDKIKEIRDNLKLSRKGNPRTLILESFASATDRLIENYDLLAQRDLNGLKEAGIDINEADVGVKFEEVTKAIFETLELNIDEDVRKEINTVKDRADVVISLSDDDIIIGEAKTCKSGDFAKYSTTSRQVKSYVNRAENNGKRVAQVLIIAPSFSDDFIESAEMDTEINISLLEAKGLKLILDAFKAKRNPKFPPKLLTKGGLLKAELIAKTI